jgi:hypothetical protein
MFVGQHTQLEPRFGSSRHLLSARQIKRNLARKFHRADVSRSIPDSDNLAAPGPGTGRGNPAFVAANSIRAMSAIAA